MQALVLLFFLASEAVLKKQVLASYPFLLIPGLAGLILSTVFLAYHFRNPSHSEEIWNSIFSKHPFSKQVMLLLLLLGVGFFFRLWHLETLQEGMTYDEAYKGLDAIAIREFGERPVFLEWNGGREALVAYCVAFSQVFLDYSVPSVRIVTAVAACATLIFFYLFSSTVFGPRLALIGTFLLAVSKVAVIHGRYGVRAGQYAVYEIAVLFLVAYACLAARHRRLSMILAGIVCGFGFYSYIAFRIFPVILLLFLLQKPIRETLKTQVGSIVLATACFLVVLAPTAIYYWQNMEGLTDRMGRTQVWREKGAEKQNPIVPVMASAGETLGMFNYAGDTIARHNVREEPALSPFTSGFFLLGLLFLIMNIRKPFAAFLILSLLISLLPGILSVGAPNFPRNLGSLPFLFVITGIGIFGASKILRLTPGWCRLFGAIVLSGAFITGMRDSLFRFPAQLDSLSTREAALWGMDRDQTQIAQLINRFGERCHVYLSPMYFFHSTVEYLTYSRSEHSLIAARYTKEALHREKIAIVIFQPEIINPWWLRDDDGKMFFKWWRQRYGMDVTKIRSTNRSSYEGVMTKVSDIRLISRLKNQYPKAREVRLGRYSALVFQP